jgi:ribosome-associated protein
MQIMSNQMLQDLGQVAYDKKGKNLLALDLRELSALSDYILIVEANVARHVKSICNELVKHIKKNNLSLASLERDLTSDWMVVDCYSVIIHVFTADVRKKYALEHFWSEGKIVELDLKINESY